jgi:Transposase DDE domain
MLARWSTSGRGSGVVGYNVQVAVDTEHHLIITHEVTNVGTDRSQLAHMAKETKATLQSDTLDAVADRGYFSSEEILACEEAGITVTLPKPMISNSQAEGRFGKQDFLYVAQQGIYICPAGERLPTTTRPRRRIGPAPLLDQRLPELRHQARMYHRQGATDHPMGARACSRGGAAPA